MLGPPMHIWPRGFGESLDVYPMSTSSMNLTCEHGTEGPTLPRLRSSG